MPSASAVPRRRLGASGLSVSAIGLGCMGMSEFYGPADQAQSLAVLHHALDIGVNFLDTADMYGSGANERLLSQLLASRRDEVVLATKFGIVRDPHDASARAVDGRPQYVRQAADASLKRLGVDHIDLYYQHRVDPQVPIEDTVGAMAGLVRAGKVRYLGLSEAAAATLRRAAAVYPIAALQSEYSLWTRDIEAEILPACRELGTGLVAYSPLGRGFLAGAVQQVDDLAGDDFRRRMPRFQGEAMVHNRNLAGALRMIAEARGCTPAQLALAWLLDRGPDVVPIPGTRRIERLQENVAATAIALRDEERSQIEEVMAQQPVVGARYPAASMAQLNR
ncbi:aldo/keto reductase [Pseudoxanthomonas wuyuanensis]|uniref:Predicted oxidoreductase n=1 Tax=Pseudoxanthomonas wuyuanensis TaxID=1073196 RepID=A0A286D4G7_9GAMM|nr:aldo/keto reductase [Pseudoxanthomonas wuyuanensis]KAF1719760.1 aldo/keto reductase [Pseudoxanthomonas wuyuanensis]SOD53563.1 Predicted oxidoreductase [Pseudoxanthomonas wuyuanensis]